MKTIVSDKHISLDCSILNLKGTAVICSSSKIIYGLYFVETEGGSTNECRTQLIHLSGFLGR